MIRRRLSLSCLHRKPLTGKDQAERGASLPVRVLRRHRPEREAAPDRSGAQRPDRVGL